MPGIVRQGDTNSAGGSATSGDQTLIVDNKPVVTVGTPVSRHAPCSPRKPKHCNARTTKGSRIFIINGKPVNIIGDPDSCGHPRSSGSRTFIIGG
jgi:uncharacterized Zn-binding protein involved in type VI secretion